jgi:cytochrome c-type biogenesis protein CcmE
MSKGLQLVVGATLIFGLLGWIGYTNLDSGSSFQYYQTLDEFLVVAASSSELSGQALRVHGYVANDSIERDLEAKQVRFRVQNDPPHGGHTSQTTLAVLYRGLETPDLFRDGAEVVVEGSLQEGGSDGVVFHAENVLAKCPSKFEANMEKSDTAGVSL